MAAEPYIPEEQTGVGPSAKIYRAHEVTENRLVRLKVLLAEHESSYFIDRDHLTDRIGKLKQVRSPRVCRLIALDVQAQDTTVVSEFAEGLNAWGFVQQSQFTSTKLRLLADQLMEALKAGEATGLPHGDLKPCNVLIESRPIEGLSLKLQDWGLAQSRHRHPRETLAFRAPELGPEDPPTLRSDLFSAGATLAAMCTGHALVEGNTVEQFRASWQGFDVAEWQAQCPHIEPSLLLWLAWLLQYHPEDRPANASEAIAALHGDIKIKRPIPPRSWLTVFILFCYNAVIIGGLAWYWLWLTKSPILENLSKWCQPLGR